MYSEKKGLQHPNPIPRHSSSISKEEYLWKFKNLDNKSVSNVTEKMTLNEKNLTRS